MADIKAGLIKMLNEALQLEHAARIQYLAHAEEVRGLYTEKIVERLTEIASDEAKHEGMFRNLIGNYLDGQPSMAIAETHKAKDIKDILAVNIKGEKEAIDFYKQIYAEIVANKAGLPYLFERLEHDIRHIIIDEEEHAVELSTLLG